MTTMNIDTIVLRNDDTVQNVTRIVDREAFFHAYGAAIDTANGDLRVVYVRFAKGGDLVEFMMNERDFSKAFNMDPPRWGGKR
jgi:hypothetical protein